MERDSGGHLKRDLRIILLGTFLATGIGTLLVDRGGNCTGKTEWDGKFKEIAACVTNENRIEISLENGEKRILPQGICRLSQIWISQTDPKWMNYFRYLDEGYSFEINGVDLETGETGTPEVYFIPEGLGNNHGKSLWCEK